MAVLIIVWILDVCLWLLLVNFAAFFACLPALCVCCFFWVLALAAGFAVALFVFFYCGRFTVGVCVVALFCL